MPYVRKKTWQDVKKMLSNLEVNFYHSGIVESQIDNFRESVFRSRLIIKFPFEMISNSNTALGENPSMWHLEVYTVDAEEVIMRSFGKCSIMVFREIEVKSDGGILM